MPQANCPWDDSLSWDEMVDLIRCVETRLILLSKGDIKPAHPEEHKRLEELQRKLLGSGLILGS